MVKLRLQGGYQNTKNNREDFALTPYLFLVKYWADIKVLGIGICWAHYSFWIGIGYNVPSNVPYFIYHDKHKGGENE